MNTHFLLAGRPDSVFFFEESLKILEREILNRHKIQRTYPFSF